MIANSNSALARKVTQRRRRLIENRTHDFFIIEYIDVKDLCEDVSRDLGAWKLTFT